MPAKIGYLGQATDRKMVVNIRPTLLIGLGGTGKEVLRRLRRMFFEKYRYPGHPVMEYLWFDTDIRAQDITGKAPDLIDRKIDFTEPEKIDGRIQPAAFEEYRRNQGAHPHVWEWFPRALDRLPSDSLMQGAGQIRACGRLSFFHHFDRIHKRIKEKGTRVGSQESMSAMQQLQPDFQVEVGTLEIVVVTSIGGGTGSGAFIDFGFLCRELFPNSIRTAFVVLPTVFDQVVGGAGVEAVHANGYAALKELEYYMQPRFAPADDPNASSFTTHSFSWDRSEHRVSAPPFSTVYLLDKVNVEGRHVEEFTDTFQMVAEFLLLDFDRTNFATEKRSVRSNLEQYMQQVATFQNGDYVQYFPCLYGSFGIAQIELNQPRLANAAAAKFASYMVEFLLAEEAVVPPGFQEANVRPALDAMNLTCERLLSLVLARPGEHFSLADRVIHQKIQPLVVQLTESVQNAPMARDINILERRVREAQDSIARISLEVRQSVGQSLTQIGTRRGEDLVQMLENITLARPKLERVLEEHCVGMLCDPLEQGPVYARAFLAHTLASLQKVKEELDAIAAQTLGDPPVQPIEVEVSEETQLYERRLAEAEGMPLAWLTKKFALRHYEDRKQRAFAKTAAGATGSVIRQIRDAQSTLEKWVRDRYRKQAAQQILAGLIDQLISCVGNRLEIKGDDNKIEIKTSGLQAKVEHFQSNLRSLRGRFQAHHNAYSQRPSGERNLSLALDLNYPVEIGKYLGGPPEDGISRELQREVLQKYFVSPEAQPLFAHRANEHTAAEDALRLCTKEIFDRSANRDRDSKGWDAVESSLDEFTFHLFENFKNDVSAAEEFWSREPEDKRKTSLQNRAALGAPRIAWRGESRPQQIHARCTLGLGSTDHALVTSVAEHVAPRLNEPYRAFPHSDDSVVFSSQWMAFPLFALGNLSELQKAYDGNVATADNIYRRHMTRHFTRYPEIRPPWSDDEVRALTEAQQPLFDGILLGVVKYDLNMGFQRSFRKEGRVYTDSYGTDLETARRTIAADPVVRDRLRAKIQEIHDGWRRQKDANNLFEQHLALMNHLVNKVFPETKIEIGGERYDANSSFRQLLTRAQSSQRTATLKILGASPDKLDAAVEQWERNLAAFATPLDYQDADTKDHIYTLNWG